MEANLLWKPTFGGRRPSVEDDLQWKITFGGRQPSVEDDLWWKTAFGGRQTSVVTPPFWTVTAQLSPNRNYYQLSQLEIESTS